MLPRWRLHIVGSCRQGLQSGARSFVVSLFAGFLRMHSTPFYAGAPPYSVNRLTEANFFIPAESAAEDGQDDAVQGGDSEECRK